MPRYLCLRIRQQKDCRNVPSQMWDYVLAHTAKTMQFIWRPGLLGLTGLKVSLALHPISLNTLTLTFGASSCIGMVPIPASVMMAISSGTGSVLPTELGTIKVIVLCSTMTIILQRLLYSVQHITCDEWNDLFISEKIRSFYHKMEEWLKHDTFDAPELVNLNLYNDISLLDEQIHSNLHLTQHLGTKQLSYPSLTLMNDVRDQRKITFKLTPMTTSLMSRWFVMMEGKQPWKEGWSHLMVHI